MNGSAGGLECRCAGRHLRAPRRRLTYALKQTDQPPGIFQSVIDIPKHDVLYENMAAVLAAVIWDWKVPPQRFHQGRQRVTAIHRHDPVTDLQEISAL